VLQKLPQIFSLRDRCKEVDGQYIAVRSQSLSCKTRWAALLRACRQALLSGSRQV
jgi:hypothetical protein